MPTFRYDQNRSYDELEQTQVIQKKKPTRRQDYNPEAPLYLRKHHRRKIHNDWQIYDHLKREETHD